MSDELIKRLRAHVACERSDAYDSEYLAQMMEEAADALERVTKEGVEARTSYTDTLLRLQEAEQRAQAAEAKAERLRKALLPFAEATRDRPDAGTVSAAAWIAYWSRASMRILCKEWAAARAAIDAAKEPK